MLEYVKEGACVEKYLNLLVIDNIIQCN